MTEHMATCEFCNRQAPWMVICHRASDLVARSIGGNERCYEAIQKMDGGACGMNYINTQRKLRKSA